MVLSRRPNLLRRKLNCEKDEQAVWFMQVSTAWLAIFVTQSDSVTKSDIVDDSGVVFWMGMAILKASDGRFCQI